MGSGERNERNENNGVEWKGNRKKTTRFAVDVRIVYIGPLTGDELYIPLSFLWVSFGVDVLPLQLAKSGLVNE
jgi:hypothetical protein